jgi:hypothetical protein
LKATAPTTIGAFGDFGNASRTPLTGTAAFSYPHPYLTAAAALGTTHGDIDAFCSRLRKCFVDARKRAQKASVAKPA